MRHALPLAAAARAAVSRPNLTFLICAVLCLLSLALVPRVTMRASNLDLIDPDLPEVSRFLHFAQEFGNPNPLIISLSQGDPDQLADAVENLAPRLAALDGVDHVVYRLPIKDNILERAGMGPYFTDDLESRFFLFVGLKDLRSDVTITAPIVTAIETILQNHLNENLNFGLTGIPKYALDDSKIIRQDITTWSIVSILVVGLIFIFGFRKWYRPLAAVACLPVGVLPTLAVISFYPGHITLLSSMFASVLFGLGIDFGIHIVSTFEFLTARGIPVKQAAVQVIAELESSLSTSALTTAGGFGVLAFSGFKGFAELGFIAAVGTLFCLFAAVTLLPVLLSRRAGENAASRTTENLKSIRTFPSHPLLALLIALAASAWLFLGTPAFEDDYRALQPADSPALALEDFMIRQSDYSPYFAAFIRENARAAEALTEQLRELKSVGSVRSLTDLSYFYEEGETPEPVPESFKRLFLDSGGRYAVYAYPAGNIWNPKEKQEFLQEMRDLDSEVTGMPFLGDFMMNHAMSALKDTALWACLWLIFILALDFRAPVPVLIALTVPAATLGITLSVMALSGLNFNPLNVMAFPIILGISVDDGVHLLHRLTKASEGQESDIRRAARGVLLTSLTTAAAFGCVALGDHRGLRSFCLTILIGVGAALPAALGLVPTLAKRLMVVAGRSA